MTTAYIMYKQQCLCFKNYHSGKIESQSAFSNFTEGQEGDLGLVFGPSEPVTFHCL